MDGLLKFLNTTGHLVDQQITLLEGEVVRLRTRVTELETELAAKATATNGKPAPAKSEAATN